MATLNNQMVYIYIYHGISIFFLLKGKNGKMFPREHELFMFMFEIGNQRPVDGRNPAPPWMVETL